MKRIFLLLLAAASATLVGAVARQSAASANLPTRGPDGLMAARLFQPGEGRAGVSVLYENGGVSCREATTEEAASLSRRSQNEPLHTISPADRYVSNAKDQGLRIVLRATTQLERFPEAKAAFVRAAAAWEDKVQTPITVILDVDFGPTLFGTPFRPGSIGASDAQLLGASGVYDQVRARLIENASNEQELAVYNALPAGSVPTDLGSTAMLRGTSANARALGLLSAVADPDGAEAGLGKPPSIGFNSGFNFDFDPSDGIDSGKYDFDAVAVHEIGHVLGFISQVGAKELDNKLPVAPALWDLFRVRPNTDGRDYSMAQRVLSSGGEQVFEAAGIELPLSTGRPNATGGDGFQASHWKNDSLIGDWYIGVMEVGIPAGKRQAMTNNDLFALQLMGYKLRGGTEMVPEPVTLQGRIDGDMLTLTGVTVNVGGVSLQARVRLLDGAGALVTEYPLANSAPDVFPLSAYTFVLSGLSRARSAERASITFVNALGDSSITLTKGILDGDSGGPALSQAFFNEGLITIKGKRLIGQLGIEVNGVLVATVTNSSNKKVKVVAAGLNLDNGPNRLRIIKDGLASNILLLSL